MIHYKTGNLVQLAIAGDFDVVIHGCNCFCTMGKGIAKEIATVWPEAYMADRGTKRGDVYKLGTYSYYCNKALMLKIVNLYTQFNVGAHFEYAAFGLGLRNLVETLKGDEIIGMPMIGAGLGGGDWNTIEEIIKNELEGFNVTIVKYENKINFT